MLYCLVYSRPGDLSSPLFLWWKGDSDMIIELKIVSLPAQLCLGLLLYGLGSGSAILVDGVAISEEQEIGSRFG